MSTKGHANKLSNADNPELRLEQSKKNSGVQRWTSVGGGSATRSEASVGLLAYDLDAPEVLPPFVWDNDYDNNEQVRPYYAGYKAVYDEMAARGAYPYNDEFKGKIPGLEGPNEDTGIYLLQTMRSLDEVKSNVSDFRAAGGVDSDTLEPGQEYRGTVAAHSWYSGGTGWKTFESTRFAYTPAGGLLFKEPGQRNWRKMMGAETLVILDKPKARKAGPA